jgi:hypothetical protein
MSVSGGTIGATFTYDPNGNQTSGLNRTIALHLLQQALEHHAGAFYNYADAKADISGRGFLGLRQMTVKDVQTGVADTTTYRQDFPYIRLLGSTTRSLGTQTLGQSTNSYQFSLRSLR